MAAPELEKISGQPVKTFAYPYGYFKPEDLSIASSSGYLAAVTVSPGIRQSTADLWLLKRLRPGNRTGAGFSAWLEDWFRVEY